jgi:hypothetical protein
MNDDWRAMRDQILTLWQAGDLTQTEIAARVRLTEQQVKDRIARARRAGDPRATRRDGRIDPDAKARFLDALRADATLSVMLAAKAEGIPLSTAYAIASRAGVLRDQAAQRQQASQIAGRIMGAMTPHKGARTEETEARKNAAVAHALRLQKAPPLTPEEEAQRIADFIARRGVTVCPSPASFAEANNAGLGWPGGRAL